MAFTLSQIQSKLSLGISFSMEQEAELPMTHRQGFDAW